MNESPPPPGVTAGTTTAFRARSLPIATEIGAPNQSISVAVANVAMPSSGRTASFDCSSSPRIASSAPPSRIPAVSAARPGRPA
jgi:hypothetical protein